jgi:hypothetical protein
MGLADRLFGATARTYGPFLVLVTFGLTVLVWWIPPETSTITVRWFLVVVVLGLGLFLITLRALYDASNQLRSSSPKVGKFRETSDEYPGSAGSILVEPAHYFSMKTAVSVYYKEDEMERLLAVGIVTNIQADGFVRVTLVPMPGATSSDFEKFKASSADELAKLIVKPNVPSEYVVIPGSKGAD